MKYYVDKSSGFTYPNGAISYCTPMPFRFLAKIVNCPCEDNKRRIVNITGNPDTMFTAPASICFKKTRISGFVTLDEDGPKFIAYKYRKNHKFLLPTKEIK